MAHKKPAIAQEPRNQKHPVSLFDPDVNKNNPLTWGLRYADVAGSEWSWCELDPEHTGDLHAQLSGIEGESLFNLLKGQRIKDIPVAHMTRGAQTRLEELGLEEAEVLWELRLNSKRRVWGLVEGAVFHFLWWDQNETACGRVPKGQRRR